MKSNTIGVIESNARQAAAESEGMAQAASDGEPDAVWRALYAAKGRLAYVEQLLREDGHTPPAEL